MSLGQILRRWWFSLRYPYDDEKWGFTEPDDFDNPEPLKYTDFEEWRRSHGVEEIDLPKSDYLCPRCHSGQVHKDELRIWCKRCLYSEALVDYPEAQLLESKGGLR